MTGSTNTAIDEKTYQKGNTLVIQSTWDATSDDVLEKDKVTLDGWRKLDTSVSLEGQGSFSVYQHGSSNIHVVIDNNIAIG
jgi:hypothetical protein